jgi:hypothetical protein
MLLPKPSERKRAKHEVEHVASIRDTPGIQHLNPACHLAAYYVYLWLRDDCHAGDLNISVLIGALNPDQLAPHVRRLPNFDELPENPTNQTWRRAWRMLCAHTLGWNVEEGDHDRFNARVNIFLHTHFFPDNDNDNDNALVSQRRCRRRGERADLRSGSPATHELRAFKRLWLEPFPPPPPPLNFMLPDAWVTPVSLPLCPPDSPELLASPPQSTQAAPQHTGSRSPRRLPDWMSHTNETCSDDHTINLLPTKIHSTYPPSTSKRSCVRRCTRDPCTHLPYKTKW